MERTKSISPEIIGLFDKIIQQAEEYHRAFELLDKRMKDFDAAISRLQEMEVKITKDTETAISKINTNILESIILLKNKTEETIKLSNDLGDISSFKKEMERLKDDIVSLQNNSAKFVEEMDKALKFFKKKSELELESTLIGLKSKIEKEVAVESQKIELRINMRLKQLEAALIGLDEKVKSFETNFSSVIKKLSLDIDIIKHGYSLDLDQSNDYRDNLANQELSDKITSLENMFNILNEKISSLSGGKITYEKGLSSDADKLENIENKFQTLSKKISLIEQKMANSQSSTSILIASIALILALLAIILKFI
jgi:predicted nuclease with TOPRIM domain